MKYDLEAALDRLAVPEELRQNITVYNIPSLLCKMCTWFLSGEMRHLSGGRYNQESDSIVLLAGDDYVQNDYSLAHELSHRRRCRAKIENTEARAVEDGLLAIQQIHPEFFEKEVKRIHEFQTKGLNKAPIRQLINKAYYQNVNLNRLNKRN